MDKRISGAAEFSALIVKAKWEGLGRGWGLWDNIPAWMRGKNGGSHQENSIFEVDKICCANLPERLAGAGLLCKVGGIIVEERW